MKELPGSDERNSVLAAAGTIQMPASSIETVALAILTGMERSAYETVGLQDSQNERMTQRRPAGDVGAWRRGDVARRRIAGEQQRPDRKWRAAIGSRSRSALSFRCLTSAVAVVGSI